MSRSALTKGPINDTDDTHNDIRRSDSNAVYTASSPSSTPTPRDSYKREAFGGFTAGVVGTVIGFPLYTIKTRMQTGYAGGGGLWTVARR